LDCQHRRLSRYRFLISTTFDFKPLADQFQHACVHLKYALRGAAMMHCLDHIRPKRQNSWCMKWFTALCPPSDPTPSSTSAHRCVANMHLGFPLNMTHLSLGHGWCTKSAWPLFSPESLQSWTTLGDRLQLVVCVQRDKSILPQVALPYGLENY
jgi:hypothetical protein